jgi:exopolysaccharide biosynthesis polyprenyl glycosylphosphotransferase
VSVKTEESTFQQYLPSENGAPPHDETPHDRDTREQTPQPPGRDVRRKRPPGLAFVVRVGMVRRICRIGSLLVIDYIGVAGSLTTVLFLKTWVAGHPSLPSASASAKHDIAFAFLVTVLLFARSDLYSERTRRPGFNKILMAVFLATLISLVFALADKQHFSSYSLFYGSFIVGVLYIGALRQLHTWGTGWLLTRAGYRRRALLVGSGPQIQAVAHALASRAHAEIDVIGFVSLTPWPDNGIRSLGTLEDLPGLIAAGGMQEVILADPEFPQEQAVELVDLCHQHGITVQIAPSTMEILIGRADFIPGQLLPLFRVRPLVFEGFDYAIKRVFDLVLATVVLIVSAPMLLAIALAVKLSSHGPVLYRSVRPGIASERFNCLKFRTMREGADQAQDELEQFNELSGALFKIRDDPRITGVGRFLRRFSLDELPQLVNVLRGEMSLVGPRPLPLRDYERLADWHKKRYLVLPGITGLWQVSGRSNLDFDDLVRLDFLYLEQWSMVLDLSILLKTVPAVLTRRGAY